MDSMAISIDVFYDKALYELVMSSCEYHGELSIVLVAFLNKANQIFGISALAWYT